MTVQTVENQTTFASSAPKPKRVWLARYADEIKSIENVIDATSESEPKQIFSACRNVEKTFPFRKRLVSMPYEKFLPKTVAEIVAENGEGKNVRSRRNSSNNSPGTNTESRPRFVPAPYERPVTRRQTKVKTSPTAAPVAAPKTAVAKKRRNSGGRGKKGASSSLTLAPAVAVEAAAAPAIESSEIESEPPKKKRRVSPKGRKTGKENQQNAPNTQKNEPSTSNVVEVAEVVEVDIVKEEEIVAEAIPIVEEEIMVLVKEPPAIEEEIFELRSVSSVETLSATSDSVADLSELSDVEVMKMAFARIHRTLDAFDEREKQPLDLSTRNHGPANNLGPDLMNQPSTSSPGTEPIAIRIPSNLSGQPIMIHQQALRL